MYRVLVWILVQRFQETATAYSDLEQEENVSYDLLASYHVPSRRSTSVCVSRRLVEDPRVNLRASASAGQT